MLNSLNCLQSVGFVLDVQQPLAGLRMGQEYQEPFEVNYNHQAGSSQAINGVQYYNIYQNRPNFHLQYQNHAVESSPRELQHNDYYPNDYPAAYPAAADTSLNTPSIEASFYPPFPQTPALTYPEYYFSTNQSAGYSQDSSAATSASDAANFNSTYQNYFSSSSSSQAVAQQHQLHHQQHQQPHQSVVDQPKSMCVQRAENYPVSLRQVKSPNKIELESAGWPLVAGRSSQSSPKQPSKACRAASALEPKSGKLRAADSNKVRAGPLGVIARRKNATRETTATLKDWLDEHGQNPYPTKGEKIMLSIITKMSLTQVSTWFANARRRMKKEKKVFWAPSTSQSSKSTLSAAANNKRNQIDDSGATKEQVSSGTSSTTNKPSCSSIGYFIQKHQKQLANCKQQSSGE